MNYDKISEKKSQNTILDGLSLNALRCFVVAAGEESFTRAAASLHVTHGAVSRAVRLLEDDLGVRLFERKNRRVFVTEAGRKLAAAVREGFSVIEAAVCTARETSENGAVLNVSCEPTLMMRWLIPRLADFQARYPHIHIHLSAGGGPVGLGHGVDVALRRNDFIWPDRWYAALLFAERIGPVCRMAERDHLIVKDEGGNPRFAAGTNLLHSQTRQDAWTVWSRLAGVSLAGTAGRKFEHFYFSLQAAAAGLGMAIGPWHLVCDDCRSGILCAPFGFIEDGSAYYLLAQEAFDEHSPAGQFHAWLCERGAATAE